MKKLIRITTVSISLKILLKGQLSFMSEHFEVVGITSPGKEIQEVEEDENIKIIPVLMSRKITPFEDLKSLWKTYKVLKNEKPYIVHTHTPKAGLVGMAAAYLAGVPLRLHTVAGLPLMEATGNKRKVLNIVEKLTYRLATKIYPNSKGLYDFITENRFTKPEKLKVLGNGSSNGINVSHFSKEELDGSVLADLKQKYHLSNNDFIFVFVGRLVGDKGINELVSAFSNLHHDHVKLLLVGSMEKELDPLAFQTIKEIQDNPRIISVGFQKDVRPFLAISNAFVFPSYREGFPNVVMQAGAMELPCIVSDINGCNEIIIEGKNGVIIPVKSEESILQAMTAFISNSEYIAKLKENSRKMIVERYEQTVVWHALLEEYNMLLNKKNNV